MSDSRSEELRLELRAIWDAVLDSHGYDSIASVPYARLGDVWDEIQGEVDAHADSESLNGLLTTRSGMTSSSPSSEPPSSDQLFCSQIRGGGTRP